MICESCENKIFKDDEFYEINGEYYCKNCVDEIPVTYYTLDHETYLKEDDVCVYNNLQDLKRKLKMRLAHNKDEINKYKNQLAYYKEDDDCCKIINIQIENKLKQYENNLKKFEELLDEQ